MRNVVLLVAHLGEAPAVALDGHEDWVVAEAAVAGRCFGDAALHRSGGHHLGAVWSSYEGHGAESGRAPAGGNPVELG